jgi:hypothetical protein
MRFLLSIPNFRSSHRTRSLMGSLHLARSEWKAALETFQGTYRLSYSQHTFSPWLKCRRAGIQALKPTDQYSWVAIGNICLSYALMSKSEKVLYTRERPPASPAHVCHSNRDILKAPWKAFRGL